MNEQTKQKIIQFAKNWAETWVKNVYGKDRKQCTGAKLKANSYFLHGLRLYIAETASRFNALCSIAETHEIMNAVLA